jgi:hypothetical protein
MKKRFLIGWFTLYIFNGFTGYLIHHVLLGSTYSEIASTLHADVQSRLWAFILISISGSFFLTLFYSEWRKGNSLGEGLKYGVLIGIWMTFNEYFSAYASSNAIPLWLAMTWIALGFVQYVVCGIILALIYRNEPLRRSSLNPQ